MRKKTLAAILAATAEDNRKATGEMIDAALVGRRRPSVHVTYECPFCTAKMPKWQCNNCGWQPEGEPRAGNR